MDGLQGDDTESPEDLGDSPVDEDDSVQLQTAIALMREENAGLQPQGSSGAASLESFNDGDSVEEEEDEEDEEEEEEDDDPNCPIRCPWHGKTVRGVDPRL